MPEWTYRPLRAAANSVLGERRARVGALRFLAGVISLPGGGAAVKRVFESRRHDARPLGPAAW
ncbi:hypothetical protein [Nocardia sp. SYP-A9097]|uniref:hypothetical protein n=1 Tax=Nocardia sp. SYP-A9097 TaxID=2663237 RepID=UPI001891C2B8|nr:hypothetical protein [Nocardia sp. SYP-A9097]